MGGNIPEDWQETCFCLVFFFSQGFWLPISPSLSIYMWLDRDNPEGRVWRLEGNLRYLGYFSHLFWRRLHSHLCIWVFSRLFCYQHVSINHVSDLIWFRAVLPITSNSVRSSRSSLQWIRRTRVPTVRLQMQSSRRAHSMSTKRVRWRSTCQKLLPKRASLRNGLLQKKRNLILSEKSHSYIKPLGFESHSI